MADDKIKILILDNVKSKVEPLIRVMEGQGFNVEFSNQYSNAEELANKFMPEVVLINLILEGQNSLRLIRAIKTNLKKHRTKIIVATGQKSLDNVKESVKAGANDFLVEPIHPKTLIDRIKYQLQEREVYDIKDIQAADPEDMHSAFRMVYDVARILAETKEMRHSLHFSLKRIADEISSPRVNIILADLNSSHATVISSSDDPELESINVDLERYPEVREVILNNGIIFIKDITQNPLTKDIQDRAKSVNIQSLLVFPIRHRAETIGALSIRLSKFDRKITISSLKTYFVIALMLSSKVAARKLLRSVKS